MRKVIGLGETVFDIIFKNGQPLHATPGGSTYNSMISLGRAGIPAEFISETGDDKVGRQIIDFLESNGVSGKHICIHKNQKSALSLAFLNECNDAEYVFYKEHDKDRLDFQTPEICPDDVILFGSYYSINPIVRNQVKPFLEYAKHHGAILYYDVNFRSSHKAEALELLPNIRENLELADIVRGSNEDFNVLYGLSCLDDVYHKEIQPFSDILIYTKGAEPAELITSKGLYKKYPASPVQSVSTIGAGDSFNAGFVCGLIREGITRNAIIHGLAESQWDKLFSYAQQFSTNVCQSLYNYIDKDFINHMKYEK